MRRKSAPRAIRRGIIFILSAPSGAGKTTLITALRAKYPGIRMSVSCTTRARRNGEVEGRHYRFLTPAQFAAMRLHNEFAEWARVHDRLYGTPRRPLDECTAAGCDILLDIDVQGARKIKRMYHDAVSIFVLPPSLTELGRRLAHRGTDDIRMIRRRLANARGEIQNIIDYDYYVVNRDVKSALRLLSAIVEAERAKTARLNKSHVDLLRSGRAPKNNE
jgi:guanylate kinase